VFVPHSVDDDAALSGALSALEEFVNWEGQQRNVMRAACSVGPVSDILQRLGSPHRQFKSVHVAGTKGKGTVSAFIEGALVEAGVNVARYGSPHVECFTERMSLNRRRVQKGRLASAIRKVIQTRNRAVVDGSPGVNSTWFDLVTAACFLILADEGVDWAIVECGLGGRLDSTNVIDAPIAVITNIDLEHTEVLGSTRAEIAGEKAGIIKSGSIVITGAAPQSEAGRVIRSRAKYLDCQYRYVQLAGSITEQNALLARAALDAIDLISKGKIGTTAVPLSRLLTPTTMSNCALPGRLEQRYAYISPQDASRRLPLPVVLDGAHVPSSLDLVLAELSKHYNERPCTILFGLNADKNAEGMIGTLAGYATRVIMTSTGKRSMDPAELCRMARLRNVVSDWDIDPKIALTEACRRVAGGWILVTGSFDLIAAVRPLIF
jgi:dihydrofolate synthase/folylpolyglutamate synthase